MLEIYNTSYKKTTNQILLINAAGIIVDAESLLFKNCIGKHIHSLHPFFNSVVDLLSKKNKAINFNCVNLDIGNQNFTIDATLYLKEANELSIFVFQELTKQYILYEQATQKKNVAEIKSQIFDFNNAILQDKETFKNNFIANFSHEIKMPVSTINGFVSLLENTKLEHSQRYNLNVIKNTNDKLKTMINDIVDISKIETNRLSILPIRYNLLEELNIIIEMYSQICKEKGLTLNYNIDTECPKYVIADRYRLAQVINNLIGNAIKFTPTGTIEFTVKCETKTNDFATLIFSVKDTGIGIDRDQIDSIFNGFYQINNNVINNGSGLGLAITKKVVLALKGKINVESKVGEGSTFSVRLHFKIAANQKNDKVINVSSI